ncbi:MAG TPA: hypothetical protein VK602_09905, partial [Phyllobacterium sp.]|nr:hypothetical protein [Phyllobacterium sp.]
QERLLTMRPWNNTLHPHPEEPAAGGRLEGSLPAASWFETRASFWDGSWAAIAVASSHHHADICARLRA